MLYFNRLTEWIECIQEICFGDINGPQCARGVEQSHHLCDYFTASVGGRGAVRECCELIMALIGDHDKAVEVRIEFGDIYHQFLDLRKAVQTVVVAP
jgi:hypothetical protein